MNMPTRIAKDPRQSRQKLSDVGRFYLDHKDSIIELFQALFDDFQNLNPSYRSVDSARDLATLMRRFDHEGLGLLTHALPDLMSDIFRHLEGGKPLYAGWKTRDGIPVFLGRLIRSVYDQDEHSIVSLAQIYQTCVLFKKLRGPYRDEVLADEQAKFLELDEEIGRIDFTAEPLQPILENARMLIETVCKDFSIDSEWFRPRPGPGATNTPVDKLMRWRPHQIFTSLDDEFPYLEWFYHHSWDPVKDAKRYLGLKIAEEATSRYKQIQKYLGKPRGICIEENEMQFFQQALKNWFYECIELHPATRGRVNFTSQEINQLLALSSSIDCEYATLDMKGASDRVARELVHRCFWNTKLFYLLDALSTRIMEMPNGDRVFTHKFAPMGSGICFPVMALIHWALIRSIIKLSSIADSEKLSKEVFVYGDDIIINTKAVEAVYSYLPLFGMKFNTDKSFHKGFFRESCGIHAFMGVDITPVYVNRVTKKSQDNKDSNVLLSLIAKEYQFHNNGYHSVSRCIQKQVHKHFWPLPTVGEASTILGWKRDGLTKASEVRKYARSVRYNPHTQNLLYSCQAVVPVRDPWANEIMEDGDGLLRKLATLDREAGIIKADVEDLRIRRRWFTSSGHLARLPD